MCGWVGHFRCLRLPVRHISHYLCIHVCMHDVMMCDDDSWEYKHCTEKIWTKPALFLGCLSPFVFSNSDIDYSCLDCFVSPLPPTADDAFPAGSTPFLSAYPGPSSLTSDPSYRSANPSTLPMAHLWASHAHEGNTFIFT